MWLLLAAGLLALPFLSLPGRYVFDTHDALWFDPSHYLARAFTLWQTSPYLGHEQHDGIVFPMGLVVWGLRSAGLAPWAAERVWHGLLLLTAAGTMILFVDFLQGRRTVLGPLTAGLVYSLTPYTFGYGLPFTGVYLPYAVLPLLLLVTLRGLDRPGFRWPALFGLTTLAMGGGNGAPQAYALLVALALIVWAVVRRRVSPIRALRFSLASLAFFVGLNAYWLFLLGSSEVSNALAFSEQPYGINVSSSASETIRGLGFWQFYGGDQFGPWIPAVRAYVTSIPLLFIGLALPVAALVSAWLVRWRYRLFFVLLLVVSVFVAMGIFQPSTPTPFGRALLFLYDHVPGASGLRTTYKAVMAMNLAVAVLVGIGATGMWRRLSAARNPVRVRVIALLALVLLVGANAYPLWTGHLYNPVHGVREVPAYWRDALQEIVRGDQAYRAFFAPATTWATYRWGAVKEGVSATDPDLPAISARRLPIGEGFGSNLLSAVERPYLAGGSPRGSAQLFRYLGVRNVVLQNDIDWARSNTAGPAQMRRLLEDRDLIPADTFGTSGRSIQILSVRDPAPIVRAESSDPVILSGDGFGMADAATEGLLQGGPPILYSGTLESSDLQALVRDARPRFLITDSNRRQAWFFTGPRAPHSYTLPAGQAIPGRNTGYLLFDDQPETQSVAVYPGLRAISASGYGSIFRASPQYRPANAFDGDPATWWVVDIGGDPTGAWIQADFQHPTSVSTVTITTPSVPWWRRIDRIQLEFSDGSTVTRQLRGNAATTIAFPERVTGFVRLRIASVSFGSRPNATGAAVGEIQIPGLDAAEIIRVPNDLLETARETPQGLGLLAGQPIRYLFERARIDTPGLIDEEAGIARRFEVGTSAAYDLTGSAHLGPRATDDAMDEIVLGRAPVKVTSSSRLLGNPRLRGSSAFDGNLSTSWVPTPGQGQWWKAEFPPRTLDHISVRSTVGPKAGAVLGLHATFSDGSVVRGNAAGPRDGVIEMRFPPRITSSVTITLDRVYAILGERKSPSIKEIEIKGVAPLEIDDSARLPCSRGGGITMDGAALAIQPSGTVGELMKGAQLPLRSCEAAPIMLGAGWHDLVARGGLQADEISLGTGQWQAPSGSNSRPSVSSAPPSGAGFDVAVRNATDPYYLVIGQNLDPGWSATIEGRDLGHPILLDGYSAGWRVDRTGSYSIAVRYRPQRTYQAALAVTGATILLAAGAISAGGVGRRRRRRPPEPRELVHPSPHYPLKPGKP
jgi:arabinofuranan 3-O-arabinosyltransferase